MCRAAYTLENLILNPVAMAVFAHRHEILSDSVSGFSSLPIPLTEKQLQELVAELEKTSADHGMTFRGNSLDFKLVGGSTVQIASEWMTTAGHGLEEVWRGVLPGLNGQKHVGRSLIRQVVEAVLVPLPALAPKAVWTLFDEIEASLSR